MIMQIRLEANRDKISPKSTGCLAQSQRESGLHEQIRQECVKNGWLAFHGSMAHRTYRTLGEPDWIILMPEGRLLMVECKTAKGKLTVDQAGVRLWAEKLGHKVHIVRSFEEFLEAVESNRRINSQFPAQRQVIPATL